MLLQSTVYTLVSIEYVCSHALFYTLILNVEYTCSKELCAHLSSTMKNNARLDHHTYTQHVSRMQALTLFLLVTSLPSNV